MKLLHRVFYSQSTYDYVEREVLKKQCCEEVGLASEGINLIWQKGIADSLL